MLMLNQQYAQAHPRQMHGQSLHRRMHMPGAVLSSGGTKWMKCNQAGEGKMLSCAQASDAAAGVYPFVPDDAQQYAPAHPSISAQ